MNNAIMIGDSIDYTADSDVSSGDVVVIGKRIGVAATDINKDATGTLDVYGVFELNKKAEAVNQGGEVYWDKAASKITTSATGNTLAGFATAAANSGDATLHVKLNA